MSEGGRMVAHLANYMGEVADRIQKLNPENGLSTDFPERLRALRRHLSMTQEEFCRVYDIPISNLRNWEQVKRAAKPDAAARLLIDMIEAEPKQMAEIIARTRNMKQAPKQPA